MSDARAQAKAIGAPQAASISITAWKPIEPPP